MKDILIVLIIVLILGAAAFAVYRAKKTGKKCIGCPESCSCSGGCNGCSCDCGGKK